jgi:copper binding plastocyanin/azurin family protein
MRSVNIALYRTMRGSKYSNTILLPLYTAINSKLILILIVIGAAHYSMAQTGQQTYSVSIRIGASVPSLQGNPQPLYDPTVLPTNPSEKGIPTKSTVTWTNNDDSYHTITSGDALTGPDRQFDSGILSPKTRWSFTFNNPGEYNYFCTVHPFMRGLIKVTG